ENIEKFFITSCLTYNYPIIWDILKYIKNNYTKSDIILGGFYPTWIPEHASKLGARLYRGNFNKAKYYIPDYSALNRIPPLAIFKLIDGCIYNCSFCCNKKSSTLEVYDVKKVINEIDTIYNDFNITYFENWDPNVMLRPDILKLFINKIKNRLPDISLSFEMGIQPNRLDEEMIDLFISSNVKSITIPLESASKNMMRYFRKPYNFNDILNSVLKLYKGGFDFRRSHFTFMLGYPEDDIEGIIGCYLIPIMVGGIPQPFPLTLTPKTLDYKRYYNLISNKDLAELNGNLFPLARSNEEFLIKEKLLSIFNSKDINLVRRGLSDISDNYKKSFDEQYEILYQFFNH
ncbi:MAG: B12-binding domain-containing radical SAM protein, partial [Myxococcota bacterium]